MFTYIFHILQFLWNFLEFFHFPKITRKWSGFPGIWEISFKVETLYWCGSYILNFMHVVTRSKVITTTSSKISEFPWTHYKVMLWLSLFLLDWCQCYTSFFKPTCANESMHIQCVPIKRKPVLSVGDLQCYARFNQTISFIIKGIFFHLIPNTMMISQCMTEKE